MSRATAKIWDAAGRPTPVKPSEDVAGVCYLCASPMATGSRVKDVCGSTFNDHDVVAAPWSTHVCQACTWCLEGKPPDTILHTLPFTPVRWPAYADAALADRDLVAQSSALITIVHPLDRLMVAYDD